MVLTILMSLYNPPRGHLGHPRPELNYGLKHPSTKIDVINVVIANVMCKLTLQLQDGFKDWSELCSTPTLEHQFSMSGSAALSAVDDLYLLLLNFLTTSQLGSFKEH